MNVLKSFLHSIGMPMPPLTEKEPVLQFRSADPEGTSGALADIERVDDGEAVTVTVTVWNWFNAGEGGDKACIGKVVFNAETGALLPHPRVGDVDEVAQVIRSMALMIEVDPVEG